MLIDKRSIEVLRFLSKHADEDLTEYQMEKMGLVVTWPTMQSLFEQHYVVRDEVEPEYRSDWEEAIYEYRIEPRGLAALEDVSRFHHQEIRHWTTLGIAVAALLSSLSGWAALILQGYI